jgi:2-keto-4-pentenoate hydratase/2-oxohepta-3-ene-1,7-dioic acid hydratase in catechol pathway
MRLLRFMDGESPRLGALSEDGVVPLDVLGDEYPTIRSMVAAGSVALEQADDVINARKRVLPLASLHLLSPIERPGKYLAIGMNYGKHLEEADKLGIARSNHQTWFNKQTSCLAGPFDDIDPGVTEKLDYEAELGLVIGRPAKAVSEEAAPDHVFAWFVANDVSARDWQFHSPTFTMGKSFDTHGPIGPWITTTDEVADPHALRVRSWVNGEARQDSDTSKMIHNVWKQIAYLSTAFTLESGDLIATGTPEGVGVGMEPPRFLQPGDVVRCEVEGLGVIENTVRRPSA